MPDEKNKPTGETPQASTTPKGQNEEKPKADSNEGKGKTDNGGPDQVGNGGNPGKVDPAATAPSQSRMIDLEAIKAEAFQQGYAAAMDDLPDPEEMEHTGDRQKMALGALACVALRLPRNMRVGSIAARLDELSEFLSQFSGVEEYIAAEMVKAIAETNPADIVSGLYRREVINAMHLINGEKEAKPTEVAAREMQEEELKRLMGVRRSNPEPPGFKAEKDKSQAAKPTKGPKLDGTEEQNDAAKMLFSKPSGGNPAS